MSKNTLLISVQTIKDRTGVHTNMDDKLIAGEIKVAQDTKIVQALGTKLMEKLQDQIAAKTVGTAEQILLDNYIADALVQFTLARLPICSSYQFFTKGVQRRAGDDSELPSMSDLMNIASRYENDGEFYRERLIRYLRLHRSVYPEFDDTSCENDIKPERSGYTISTWLGED